MNLFIFNLCPGSFLECTQVICHSRPYSILGPNDCIYMFAHLCSCSFLRFQSCVSLTVVQGIHKASVWGRMKSGPRSLLYPFLRILLSVCSHLMYMKTTGEYHLSVQAQISMIFTLHVIHLHYELRSAVKVVSRLGSGQERTDPKQAKQQMQILKSSGFAESSCLALQTLPQIKLVCKIKILRGILTFVGGIDAKKRWKKYLNRKESFQPVTMKILRLTDPF